jgi:hypothetical protein
VPFKGFLGPSWKMAIPTRILHRLDVYYHRYAEYSSGKCILCIFFQQINPDGEFLDSTGIVLDLYKSLLLAQ